MDSTVSSTTRLPPAPRTQGTVAAVSPQMHVVLDLVRRLAASDVTVTVLGETGSGKDVVAHSIHEKSKRAKGPFVVFDCGAVPPNLIESELFGHEKGSFAGAHADHPGAFESAQEGTLFLDEIGELPLDLQPRLLRAVDNRCVRRVGGTKDRRIDVRIVAATNRDLATAVGAKQFRQDLYFRLAAAVIHLPPLRERLEDLPLLVARLLCDLGRGEVTVAPGTYEVFGSHMWPGNVRELKNTLAYALAFADHDVLEPHHIRFVESTAQINALEKLPLGGQSLESLERIAIKQTLNQTRGNKVHAARVLGIAASTLYEKLKRYGI